MTRWSRRMVLMATITILLIANSGLLHAEEREKTNALFDQANQLYAEGDYQGAVESYEEILKQGYTSGPLFYNLANAYFRIDQKGRARLNYLRAAKLMPRDPDLRTNLAYVEEELGVAGKEAGFLNWLAKYLTLRELAWVTVSIFALFVSLFLARTYLSKLKKRLQFPLYLFLVLFLFSLSLTGITYYAHVTTEQGVVTVSEALVRFEPSDTGQLHYTLAEGQLIDIEECRGDWVLVQRSDGKKGWVKNGQIELFDPTISN